jgi:hypothetical protein
VATSALGRKLFLVNMSSITGASPLFRKLYWNSNALSERGSRAGINKAYITCNRNIFMAQMFSKDPFQTTREQGKFTIIN